METRQFFETTVVSDESNHEARVISVPARSLPPQFNSDISDVLASLGLNPIATATAIDLGYGFAELFSAAMLSDHIIERLAAPPRPGWTEGEPLPAVAGLDVQFAEVMAFQDIVPFEQSPLTAQSLAKLMTQAGGAGIGAYAGFVAFGASPLFLLMIPAGMILCGAAKGVADALEQGLREKILHLMKSGRRTTTARMKKHRAVRSEGPSKPSVYP